MSVITNPLLLGQEGGSGGGGSIQRSLRFNSSDSAYLSRTPASAGNRTVYTIAFWIKRTKLAVDGMWLFRATSDASNYTECYFSSNDKLNFQNVVSGSANTRFVTTQVFRDPSAWYHLVFSINGSTAAKLYVNGTEVTTFDSTTGPGASNHQINNTVSHTIGRNTGSDYADLYLSDFYLIDGQALDPTSFGEFDDNGIWQPIAYSGSYGTNGFHLPFSDNSTTAALGTDTSGNSNTWAVNNFSVASGSGNDSLVDVPINGDQTDTGVGGEVRGNYCTLNPLDNGTGKTYSNGNLEVSDPGSGANSSYGTTAVSSGKWYWEVRSGGVAGEQIGFADANAASGRSGNGANGWVYEQAGRKVSNNTYTSYGTSYANGDIIGIALNMDAGEVTFYKNGVSQGVAFNSGLSGKAMQPLVERASGFAISWVCNFGQRPFAYPVSGYKSLCTANLPAPVITKPSEYMDIALYTGNGSTQTISGLEFSPDLIWVKSRSAAYSTTVYDTVRGAYKSLATAVTNAEGTNTSGLSAFNSDGFNLDGENNVLGSTNINAVTYAAWTWDAGDSTVTNTDGSITSSVRANPSAGFSIATWSYTSGDQSFGHGLGVTPAFVVSKATNNTSQWIVYHSALGTGQYIYLSLTDAAASNITNVFSGTNSSVLSFRGGLFNPSRDYVSYCFAPVAGYSAFGSYVGNGSADGSFVYTGFRPRWVMIKESSAGSDPGHWMIIDTARSVGNQADNRLHADLSDSEYGNFGPDILSNGFKLRNASAIGNFSGVTYIYAAFAESPLNYARAR